MTPLIDNDDLQSDFVFSELPTNTFKVDFDGGRVFGRTDEREAMKQAIYLILNVERYKYPIYSWNYGAELNDLIGMPPSFCVPEIERRITEALLWDTRITAVRNFEFDTERGKISVKFEAVTVYGTITTESAVNV